MTRANAPSGVDPHNGNNNNNNHATTTPTTTSDSWSADQLLKASYKDLGTPIEVENRFLNYLLTSPHCLHDLENLLYESSVVSRDYSIPLDSFDFIQHNPILGYMLLQYPQTLLPLLENAVVRAQLELVTKTSNNDERDESCTDRCIAQQQLVRQPIVKGLNRGEQGSHDDNPSAQHDDATTNTTTTTNSIAVATTRVHARLVHLPPQCCKTSLGSLEACDVGKIWQVSGTVVRVGPVQMYESTRTYQCVGVSTPWFGGGGGGARRGNAGGGGGGSGGSRNQTTTTTTDSSSNQQGTTGTNNKPKGCGRVFAVHADLEQQNNALQQPERCPYQLFPDQRCPGNKFEIVTEGSVHTDYQEIKIQEAAGGCGGMVNDSIPRSLLIKLQHDLVDHCQPGDEVVIVGILLAQWPNTAIIPDMECHVGIAMSAHSIRVVADQGSSAWKHTALSSTSMGGTRNNNSLGDTDKYRKEFQDYWDNPVHQVNPIIARDHICKAMCPKLYGLQIIKLAMLITLIGGVSSDAYDYKEIEQDDGDDSENQTTQRKGNTRDCMNEHGPDPFELIQDENSNKRYRSSLPYDDQRISNSKSNSTQKRKNEERNGAVKTRRRDMSHLLLVGDPGTGKSQFLRFAAALCPRSVLTTGVGTTSAGLTCAAVRDGSGGNGKEFALEAGALVLADKGVCCIDEFGCIQKSDRTTIHEAMEQQTLSVAKAGIVCKLNCRTTIIAVMNPIDCLYDNQASLAVNTGLGTPLLSRFDLIFKLVDTSDAERDSNVTTYLLNRAIQGNGYEVSENNINQLDNQQEGTTNDTETWRMEKLRAYISIVKERFQPNMGDDAALLLERHYEKCRSQVSNTIPVTVRFLESLIRLSQAHARLMHRNVVTLQDAVAVIQVMESTAFAYGGFDGIDATDYGSVMYRDPMTTDFSPEADLDFLCFEYQILNRYGMLSYIDDNRRKKSQALLACTSAHTVGTGSTTDNWETIEQGHIHHGVYSRNIQSSSPCEWNLPTQPTVAHDHYDRVYFTPSSSQPKRSKR